MDEKAEAPPGIEGIEESGSGDPQDSGGATESGARGSLKEGGGGGFSQDRAQGWRGGCLAAYSIHARKPLVLVKRVRVQLVCRAKGGATFVASSNHAKNPSRSTSQRWAQPVYPPPKSPPLLVLTAPSLPLRPNSGSSDRALTWQPFVRCDQLY